MGKNNLTLYAFLGKVYFLLGKIRLIRKVEISQLL